MGMTSYVSLSLEKVISDIVATSLGIPEDKSLTAPGTFDSFILIPTVAAVVPNSDFLFESFFSFLNIRLEFTYFRITPKYTQCLNVIAN